MDRAPLLEGFNYQDECLLLGNTVDEMKSLNGAVVKGNIYLSFHP